MMKETNGGDDDDDDDDDNNSNNSSGTNDDIDCKKYVVHVMVEFKIVCLRTQRICLRV
jgi:hypothetical protein